MVRQLVTVRDAVPDDAPALLVFWHDLSRRSHLEDPVGEARAAIARAAADPDQRIVVLDRDHELVGAVHLRRTSFSPLTDEKVVNASHLQVLTGHRKHGLGHLLADAAVTWAEEKGISYVVGVSAVGARDANRFLARLGLGQVAVFRGAATTTLRTRLSVAAAARGRSGAGRRAGQVLATRRTLRRRHGVTDVVVED
ncbi:MAG: GNAT family N-acetyltransferase [Nocardioides sp.]|nr:GNAT family N-acetyltransferase [Nocardioides sp.]